MYLSVSLILLCFHYGQGYPKTCSVDPTASRVENAALQKPAKQSSTHNNGIASKAVDGNANPKYNNGSCIHTAWTKGLPLYNWWIVDLEREYQIESVTITNRLNYAERVRDFDIFVSLNSTFDNNDQMTDGSLCYHVTGEMEPGETRTFICQKSPLFGQFVQIFMNITSDQRNINLCEVTVQGYPLACSMDSTKQTLPTTETAPFTTAATSMTTSNLLSTTTPSNTTTPTPISIFMGPGILKSAIATAASNTTIVATSTELPTTGNTTTPTTPTCPCVCGNASSSITNLTMEDLVELVKELTKELTVSKKETSSYKRTLISVGDQRQSAQTIGAIGVLALCVPVLLIVLFDLMNLWSFRSKKKVEPE